MLAINDMVLPRWAPTSQRARMLAIVFGMQSLGQFFAALVAFLALRGGLALDSTWRLVYGLGAVPAAVALVCRLTIPESPRYTFDVAQNPNLANYDVTYTLHGQARAEEQRHSQLLMNGVYGFPPKASCKDAKDYFITQGNWRHLVGTAGAWMLLDLSFYGLGLNSPQIVTGIYNGCLSPSNIPIWDLDPTRESEESARQMFMNNASDYIEIVSIGAIAGSVIFVFLINAFSRRKLQISGFLLLFVVFSAIGAILVAIGVDHTGSRGAVQAFYVLCQVLFNLGEILRPVTLSNVRLIF